MKDPGENLSKRKKGFGLPAIMTLFMNWHSNKIGTF